MTTEHQDPTTTAEPRESPEIRLERVVTSLEWSVRRWTLACFLAATGIGFLIRRRASLGILLGTLFGYGSFQMLVSVVMRVKGATGSMFGAALAVSLLKFGLLVAAVVGLWHAGLDLLELLGGLLASQFAIVAGCARALRPAAQDNHARP